MGLLGKLFGWDQAMSTMNAVLASHLIEHATTEVRKNIARQVVAIFQSVNRMSTEDALDKLSKEDRAVQMNFIALACDNLGIAPTVPKNVWTRIRNPFLAGREATPLYIETAIETVRKKDGVSVSWVDKPVNFRTMYNLGHI